MKSAHIAEQIAQVDRDLVELDEQVEAGELDEATADRLRTAYRSERATLEKQLDEIGADEDAGTEPTADEDAPAASKGRSKGRAIAGTAVVAVAVAIVAVVAIFSLQDQSTAADVTDGIATGVLENQVMGGGGTTGGASGMDSVSTEQMEAAVAENPDVVGMRMALAELYIQEGDLDKALEHYNIVLEQEPDNAEALVRVGWLTSLADDPEGAEPFFIKALDIDPNFPQAYWFLANVRFDLGRKSAAIAPLQALLTFKDIPDEVRTEATKMLEEARS